ncbi:hypothetical protein GGI07_002411 [Coemansia sp. Benny D115]|nr:hypothetical protein GGI07_002411 [Coemansia sp. Benny D115]
MPAYMANFTEPSRLRNQHRPALTVSVNTPAPAIAPNHGASTYGPSSSSPTPQHTRFFFGETADLDDARARHATFADDNSKGCVPPHRSVLRLFRRKLQSSHHRSSSSASHLGSSGMRANPHTDINGSTSTASSASYIGGYMRSKKVNKAVTLSAQRTRSELAIEGPPPLAAARSDIGGLARNPRQLFPAATASASSPAMDAIAPSHGVASRHPASQSQPRLHRADKGTIVQLRSSPSEKRIVIPTIDDLQVNIDIAESVASEPCHASSADELSRDTDADADADADVDIDADIDADTATDSAHRGQTAESTPTSAKPAFAPFLSRAFAGSNVSRLPQSPRSPRSPRKSVSSVNVNHAFAKQLDAEVEQHTVSDDELLVTTNPDVAVHVLPDDSSDWNSDFSSPASWRRSSDRPVSRRMPYRLDTGGRLKDRAIDRGVLEAQQRILQQEKHLIQISSLSGALAKLRPLILRCLVFELPDRGISVGTSSFVSGIREPCGSIEPSIEEERLWELWRQAEALLTIMDNDNVPLNNIESRLTLSKKRAIMLAFSDWEQYSLYVQDAWDKARRGTVAVDGEQPPEGRQSTSNDSTSASDEHQFPGSTPRTSYDGCSISGFSPASPRALIKFSLSMQRKTRRRSVVGVAPASLQRIADEAAAIREECEQLLMLMSPLYREGQLSPRGTMASNGFGSPIAPPDARPQTTPPAPMPMPKAKPVSMPATVPAPAATSGSFSFSSSPTASPDANANAGPRGNRERSHNSDLASSPSLSASVTASTPCPPISIPSSKCANC